MATMNRRAVLTGLSALIASPAMAGWPEQAIVITHGLAPGGGVDVTARILAEQFSVRLGRQVIVEAKPGAASTVAAGHLARSAPDGYSIAVFPSTYAAAVSMRQKLAFRPVEDFTTIGLINEFPYIVATHADHAIKTLQGLLADGGSGQPLLYGTPGQGSAQHLLMAQLGLAANIKLQHVPFKGGPEALTEVIAKRIDLVVDVPVLLGEHISSGVIRALAVTTRERSSRLPQVPAVSETGLTDFDVRGWMGLVGPAALPDKIIRRFSSELTGILADASVVQRFVALGAEPRVSGGLELKTRLASDIAKWTKVIHEAGIERI
jgi:tripartite-type tricarboxylate transporter receptor subunit TctC